MKKKITSLLVVVALALGVLALAGCNWFEANSISFINPPATTYVINDQADLEFTIEVSDSSGTHQYTYSENKNLITVSNFSTETAGTRTAIVRYDNKFQLQFTYTVLDGRYSGGTGTQTDPYLVSTPVQFQNLLDETTFKYYKITRTIDFTGVELRMANKGDLATSAEAWTGYIDGSNYSLLNLRCSKTEDGVDTNKYNELFGRVGSKENGKFVMKNLTVNFAATGNSAIPGLVFANGNEAEISFENVNLTGYIDAQYSNNSSLAPYVNFVNRSVPGDLAKRAYPIKSLSFKDCNNSIKILNSYSVNNVSGFVSTMGTVYEGNVTFDNCSFNGIIEGSLVGAAGIGAFVTDSKTVYNSAKPQYVFNNCSAQGAKLVKTDKDCGAVYISGTTSVANINVSSDLVDDSLKPIAITTGEDKLTITATPDSSVVSQVKSYKVFAYGSMTYWGSTSEGGGGFRCLQPVQSGEIVNGVLTKTLYKVGYDNENTTNNTDTSCGSNLFVLNNNVITYYCKSVCKNINKITQIIVVAYNESGNVVAIGSQVTSKTANNVTTVYLDLLNK